MAKLTHMGNSFRNRIHKRVHSPEDTQEGVPDTRGYTRKRVQESGYMRHMKTDQSTFQLQVNILQQQHSKPNQQQNNQCRFTNIQTKANPRQTYRSRKSLNVNVEPHESQKLSMASASHIDLQQRLLSRHCWQTLKTLVFHLIGYLW